MVWGIMAAMSSSQRPGLWTSVAVGATVALGVLAAMERPQGDVTRTLPYLVAAVVVWTGATTLAHGPRSGLQVALALGAVVLSMVGAYRLLIEPIPTGECRALIQELRRPPCRDEGPVLGVVVALTAATFATGAAVMLHRRR
jgi:hypothetical protein